MWLLYYILPFFCFKHYFRLVICTAEGKTTVQVYGAIILQHMSKGMINEQQVVTGRLELWFNWQCASILSLDQFWWLVLDLPLMDGQSNIASTLFCSFLIRPKQPFSAYWPLQCTPMLIAHCPCKLQVVCMKKHTYVVLFYWMNSHFHEYVIDFYIRFSSRNCYWVISLK